MRVTICHCCLFRHLLQNFRIINNMATHLVVCLSSGFGHIGQTAGLLHALRTRIHDLQVTIRSTAPQFKLIERFWPEISVQKTEVDIGWIQRSTIEIDLEESAISYKRFHTDWQKRVSNEARDLHSLDPDLVLANVPYLPLAGAAEAGIPSIAFCSINWAEIYRYYYIGRRVEALAIETEMLNAYNTARHFIRPEPAMRVTSSINLLPIGTVAQLGTNRREELNQLLQLNSLDRLVLISLGGMDVSVPVQTWP